MVAPKDSPRQQRPGLPSFWLALGGLLLLHLSNPLAWGYCQPALWFPPAGIGLALVAWFGPRAALLVLVDGLLLVLQGVLLGWLPNPTAAPLGVGLAVAQAVLGAVELPVAWSLYHRRGRGARSLDDPHSAKLFLFLVPGLVTGLFALCRTVLLSVEGDGKTFAGRLAAVWLGQALGLLILAPPLLVLVTPWLRRYGLLPEHDPGYPAEAEDEGTYLGPGTSSHVLAPGDWLEMVGLAAGASVLNVLLVRLYGRHELSGWQLWGAPLLLIVWASLRQSLRGGTLLAGAAAACPLLLLPVQSYGDLAALLLQANLLAQCGTALLVAVSIGWIRARENRYQQVGHLPVVVYSARFLPGPSAGASVPPASWAVVTLVSTASERVLGTPPGQLLGGYERWLQHVHPDDREVLQAAVAQLGRQEQPVTCEYRLAESVDREPPSALQGMLPDPQGELRAPRWVRDTLAPHRDAAGRLTGWEGVVTDITEQRALADDLRRTTNMFHALVSNLPTGVFFVQGKHGQPILVNARARQLLGQREDPTTGLEHLPETYHLFRPDGSPYPAEELPVFQALRRGQTSMRDDIVVQRPDGQCIALMSWAAPVSLGKSRGAGGEADAAVWVLEDWTALQKAEAARRDTEGRLRAIVSAMAEGLVVEDASGRVVECNPAACALLGHGPDELRGRPLAELDLLFLREDSSLLPEEAYPARMVARTGQPVRNVVLGIRPLRPVGVAARGARIDEAQDLSTSWLAASGPMAPVRWVLVNAMPLARGNPRAGNKQRGAGSVVTTYSDITAYAQARQIIEASEERYRGLVESLPLLVLQADLHRRLTYLNPATRAVTGYGLEEIAEPAAWEGLIHPEDRPRVAEVVRDSLAGRAGRVEFRYRAKDGSEKAAYALVQPSRLDGAVAGTTLLLVDMTRERQLERELQRSQRLELIGRLSSGIAHDFNNLLSVVLTLTDLARSHLPPDHAVHAELRRITQAGQQAANLAGQLLSFSGQKRSAARRVEINRAVRRALELLRATLPSRVQLESVLEEGDLFVRADETELQQVLMNLCLNARDAMPHGGRLRVETGLDGGLQEHPHPAARNPQARWVRLSVLDDGMGISDTVKERIFESFYTTKERGTGLGLAVVQQIVEASGGRIEVSSQPGRGARFDVLWPLAEEPRVEGPETIPEGATRQMV